MKRLTPVGIGLLALVCVLVVAAIVSGGQLEPPGPVMATDRVTLNGQLVHPPHTITEPGSYVLTSDIRYCRECDGPATDGIIIDANDVTFDLNGFALIGGPDNSLSGIVVRSGRENVVIRNGVVRDWAGHGVADDSARGARIEHIRASNNGGNGIVAGPGGIVTGSTASNNRGRGIVVAPASVVTHCTATDNGEDGIVAVPTAVPSGSTIARCAARDNGGAGILTGDGTTIEGCALSRNAGAGISTGLGCTIRGNTAVTNGGGGILTYDSLVLGNTARFNTGANINATDSTVIDNHTGS